MLACLAAAAVVLFPACRSVSTLPATGGGNIVDGMVYHLPRSFLKISIESKKDDKGNHKELAIGAGSEIVPDKEARLRLKRSGNELFARNHGFTFTNGLLSSIDIHDEGKAGEVIQDLAAIAFNIVSMGAAPMFPLGAIAPPADALPSSEEVLAALSSVTPGEQSFVLDISGSTGRTPLAGTRELVTFSAVTKDLPPAPARPNEGFKDLTEFDGIAVKLPEPYPVNVSLHIDRSLLLKQRVDTAKAKIKDLTKQKEDNAKAKAEAERKLGSKPPPKGGEKRKLQEELTGLAEAAKKIEQGLVTAAQSKVDNEGFLDSVVPADRYYEIVSRDFVVMFPDFSPIVRIPLNRSPLGKTKYSLALSKGVLTEFHGENPSIAVETVKVPLNITKALVALPTEILKLKLDYSSKAKELAAKEAEYLEAEKALKKTQQGPTQQEQDVTALQQQQQILSLQKEIAALKAAIAEIEKKAP
jgi:hypothetical protein